MDTKNANRLFKATKHHGLTSTQTLDRYRYRLQDDVPLPNTKGQVLLEQVPAILMANALD